jgi:hypothetical protein
MFLNERYVCKIHIEFGFEVLRAVSLSSGFRYPEDGSSRLLRKVSNDLWITWPHIQEDSNLHADK